MKKICVASRCNINSPRQVLTRFVGQKFKRGSFLIRKCHHRFIVVVLVTFYFRSGDTQIKSCFFSNRGADNNNRKKDSARTKECAKVFFIYLWPISPPFQNKRHTMNKTYFRITQKFDKPADINYQKLYRKKYVYKIISARRATCD